MSKAPQSQGIQRNRKVQPIQRKNNNNNSTKSVPEKDLTADVWDKGFKAMVFKVIKELKEEWRKSRKWFVGKTEISIKRKTKRETKKEILEQKNTINEL